MQRFSIAIGKIIHPNTEFLKGLLYMKEAGKGIFNFVHTKGGKDI